MDNSEWKFGIWIYLEITQVIELKFWDIHMQVKFISGFMQSNNFWRFNEPLGLFKNFQQSNDVDILN